MTFLKSMALLMALAAISLFCAPSGQASRIKDIASLQGVRDNQLVGYGLVVGLNGTGDSAGTQFTILALVNMMERMGLSVDRSAVKVDNAAMVIATAELPPFAKPGSPIDVMVSSMGDADSLSGGTLLMTPLKGPDGKVYAVAQGSLIVGGMSFGGGGGGSKVQKNHPTVGRIPGGALVEREVAFSLPRGDLLTYRLQDSDFTTVTRFASVVNRHFRQDIAVPQDSGGIQITLPKKYRGHVVDFIAAVENLEVQPDFPAKIVINEKTGTIVMGEEVRLSTVAVSHGNLNLVVTESTNVSQPEAFSQGSTMAVPETKIEVDEEKGQLIVLKKGVSIGQIARALNAIGASSRDLISIFQAIKAAGGLHAELVIL